jgi:hypothetical protein
MRAPDLDQKALLSGHRQELIARLVEAAAGIFVLSEAWRCGQ